MLVYVLEDSVANTGSSFCPLQAICCTGVLFCQNLLECFWKVWGVSANRARSICSSLQRIVVPHPGYSSRSFEDGRYVFLQEIKIDKDLDVSAIAGSTIGFTGADLANLVNEAALLAARKVS
jgi:hypothetical protein